MTIREFHLPANGPEVQAQNVQEIMRELTDMVVAKTQVSREHALDLVVWALWSEHLQDEIVDEVMNNPLWQD